jgi:hypothetical protein
MKINQDYNIVLVHQFFATVVFGEGEDIPLTWMLGSDVCRSSFHEFSNHLGYSFAGATAATGLRMHVEGVAYNKRTLKPLYGKLASHAKKKEVVLCEAYGLKTRYNILLCHLLETISRVNDILVFVVNTQVINLLFKCEGLLVNARWLSAPQK